MSNRFIFAAALAVLLPGCRPHRETSSRTEDEDRHSAGEIVISEKRQLLFGIESEIVERSPFQGVIRTGGQLLSANDDEQAVVAVTSGIIRLADLTEGSPVGKGTWIATVSSQGLETGDRFVKIRTEYETAKGEFERDQELLTRNIVSQSHYDQSKMSYEQAKAAYDALRKNRSTDGGIAVLSPLAGYVKSLQVTQGEYVETGQTVATVSRNRRLLLKADVSEKYYGELAHVRDANFKTSYSSETFRVADLNGRLVGYGRSTDKDYYLPVTFEIDNRKGLVPGSYAEVFLKTGSETNCLTVPLASVVDDQGIFSVFVREEPDAFVKREVRIGASDGVRIQILSGIREGESVVTKGTIFVKLASVSPQPAGHSHSH